MCGEDQLAAGKLFTIATFKSGRDFQTEDFERGEGFVEDETYAGGAYPGHGAAVGIVAVDEAFLHRLVDLIVIDHGRTERDADFGAFLQFVAPGYDPDVRCGEGSGSSLFLRRGRCWLSL